MSEKSEAVEAVEAVEVVEVVEVTSEKPVLEVTFDEWLFTTAHEAGTINGDAALGYIKHVAGVCRPEFCRYSTQEEVVLFTLAHSIKRGAVFNGREIDQSAIDYCGGKIGIEQLRESWGELAEMIHKCVMQARFVVRGLWCDYEGALVGDFRI